jgi:uncharacterized pyridoxal phosphate-containing UPF0001 family protein
MSVATRLQSVLQNMPSTVTLVAVSKLHPHQSVRAAYEAGQRHFGENYVDEMKAKAERVDPELQLQSIARTYKT